MYGVRIMNTEILQDLEQQNNLLKAINSNLKKKNEKQEIVLDYVNEKMTPTNSKWVELHSEKLTKPDEIKKVPSDETSFLKEKANSITNSSYSLCVIKGQSTPSHMDRKI